MVSKGRNKNLVKKMSLIFLTAFIQFVSSLNSQQKTALTLTYKGYRLEGCVLNSIHVPSSIECVQHCLADQRCKSVNYQRHSSFQSIVCELNNSTKTQNLNKFTQDDQFIHYELQIIQLQLEKANPLPTAPKNCSAFLPGRHPSGNYTIYDSQGNVFTVWCHLDHERGKAWTLVMSLSLVNRVEPKLTKVPLTTDAPVNDDNPNLNRYRLSLARMTHIRSQSTSWSAVCNFDGATINDRIDTVRATFSIFDPLTLLGRSLCKKVNYINVRGYSCKECTAAWFQLSTNILHVDSNHDNSCDLDAKTGSVSSEDNFGLYAKINNAFGCSKDDQSTTSWWFGN